jgi:hypothetical protein
VSRKFRMGLIWIALVFAAGAFLLRIMGVDQGKTWWDIALPGVVAITMIVMLFGELRSPPGGNI